MVMTSNIYDQNPGSVLSSLAETLGVEIEEKLNQCVLEIPAAFGEGSIRLLSFSHGVSIISFSIKLNRVLELTYNDGSVHPLKILLIKQGHVKHAFDKGDKTETVGKFESLLVASTPEKRHTFKLPRNQKIDLLSIQVNRKRFEPKIEDFIPHMNKELSRLFRDVNGIREFHYKGHYHPESLRLVDYIISAKETDVMESVKIEGLTFQLITLQLKNYVANISHSSSDFNFASNTREKLAKALHLIENEISDYKSVKDLSKKLNINEKTLQSAFKQYYGVTVNTYVRDFRARKARMYLEESGLTVSEISYKLGLSSPGNLSKLFKIYYNCSPSEYRNKTKS